MDGTKSGTLGTTVGTFSRPNSGRFPPPTGGRQGGLYGEHCHDFWKICIGMNVQVKTALEHRDWDFFIFAENDIRPDLTLTAPFLEAEGDVVCAEYETECMHDHAWGPADAFHTGLWRTTRRVLETMEPPYFLPQYNSDATAVVGCHCNHLRRKLAEKGFRICHTGRVDHSPQHPSILAAEKKPLWDTDLAVVSKMKMATERCSKGKW